MKKIGLFGKRKVVMETKNFDIFNSRIRKVRCVDNSVGADMANSCHTKSLLKVGAEYTIAKVEVHDWYTLLCLKEFPGETFNSIAFCEVA